MRAARVAAQGKVNLFLHVLARESGGFHQIDTLFQRLELADDVTVRVDVPGRALDCRGADVGPVERNLAWRAALAYAAATGWPRGFAIEVEKRIPAGGGLGGGSADAAAVLRALDALAPAPLPAGRLLEVALGLGSDVPFLASDAALALAWGRGERMLALPALPPRRMALLLPGVGVPTGEAYGWLAHDRGDAPRPRPRLLRPGALADWRAVAALAANDFEGPVAARVPAVAALAAAAGHLRDGAAGAGDTVYRMSGSGSTWFLLGGDEGAVGEAAAAAGWRVVWTTTSTSAAPVAPLAGA